LKLILLNIYRTITIFILLADNKELEFNKLHLLILYLERLDDISKGKTFSYLKSTSNLSYVEQF